MQIEIEKEKKNELHNIFAINQPAGKIIITILILKTKKKPNYWYCIYCVIDDKNS